VLFPPAAYPVPSPQSCERLKKRRSDQAIGVEIGPLFYLEILSRKEDAPSRRQRDVEQPVTDENGIGEDSAI
jgi:hypothetical protein